MAYSRVTRTHDGRSALLYAEGKDKGHNNKEFRNAFISYVNMVNGIPAHEQMQRYWSKARPNHKVQVLRIIQSFSVNEFDPESREDILKANELGREFAKEYYDGRQSAIFTQIDGKSGLVHNHILVNDVHMENYKGCQKHEYFYKTIEDWTNAVTAKYTTLDFGKKNKEKLTQTERAKLEKGEYVWKEDLRTRVRKAMEETDAKEDFMENLKRNGISAVERKSKKYGDYYTYELVDLSKVPEGAKLPNHGNLKARSYKLGASYSPEALNDYLKEKERFSKKTEVKKQVETIERKEPDVDKEEREKKVQEFTDFTREIGESWMSYDANNNPTFDWDKYEELQARFEEHKKQKEEPVEEEKEVIEEEPEIEIPRVQNLPETSEVSEKEIEEKKKKDKAKMVTMKKEQETILRKNRRLPEGAEDIMRKLREAQTDNEFGY